MKIRDLKEQQVPAGTRIKVTSVAQSEAEDAGYVNDTERLMGETGTVINLVAEGGELSQLWVDWDNDAPGSLMLASKDEIEVVNG